METTEVKSQFEGTPWKNDDEIYDFSRHRKYRMGLEWEDVKEALINEGLEEGYATQIIANLKDVEDFESGKQSKKRYRIVIIASILWAVLAVFIIKPITQAWWPEHERLIFILITGFGIGLINQYGKDK